MEILLSFPMGRSISFSSTNICWQGDCVCWVWGPAVEEALQLPVSRRSNPQQPRRSHGWGESAVWRRLKGDASVIRWLAEKKRVREKDFEKKAAQGTGSEEQRGFGQERRDRMLWKELCFLGFLLRPYSPGPCPWPLFSSHVSPQEASRVPMPVLTLTTLLLPRAQTLNAHGTSPRGWVSDTSSATDSLAEHFLLPCPNSGPFCPLEEVAGPVTQLFKPGTLSSTLPLHCKP